MLESMVAQHTREENSRLLSAFLYELNQRAYRFDLAAPASLAAEALRGLAQLLARWNESFFLAHEMKVELLLLASRADNSSLLRNVSTCLTEAGVRQHLELLTHQALSCKLALFVFDPALEGPGLPEDEAAGPEGGGGVDLAGGLRFWLMSHQDVLLGGLDFFGVVYLQLSLLMVGWILLLTLLADLQDHFDVLLILPYPFVQFLTISLGFIWVLSNSYGIGKLFTILNSLSFVDQLLQLAAAVATRDSVQYMVLKGVSVLPYLCMVFSSRRLLYESKKLNKLYLK